MKIYSVSELTDELKNLLEANFPQVWVAGEVSNFKAHHNGHYYFNLKDEGARLAAVMFRGNSRLLKFAVEEGMAVVCGGRLTVYPPYGNYQIIVTTMEPQGLGALQLAFEQLKEKLAQEGLFDEERKRALPLVPRRIGIVTSQSGAALRDFLRVATRRYPNVEILVSPTAVQGAEATRQIVAALERLGKLSDIDVIVVARGGGSIEDLWAFNEEAVARAIAATPVPVVSAIGHETDFTIADFVADVRAPTPSAAAEMVVPSKEELVYTLAQWQYRLQRSIKQFLELHEQTVHHLQRRLKDPRRRLDEISQRVDDLRERATRALRHRVELMDSEWRRASAALRNLNPLAILERGYCVATPIGSERPLTSSEQVKAGDQVKLQLAQGGLLTEVRQRVKS